ncbi:uncharacterized protein WM294_012506 [Sarcoramphus papa]
MVIPDCFCKMAQGRGTARGAAWVLLLPCLRPKDVGALWAGTEPFPQTPAGSSTVLEQLFAQRHANPPEDSPALSSAPGGGRIQQLAFHKLNRRGEVMEPH